MITIESSFIFLDFKEHTNKALSEIKRIKKFYQKGYDKKSWEEKNPDVIKKLISAERNLTEALLDIEELMYDKGDKE